ncbi:hypothetical protein [Mesorhizobium sp. BR1-1-16]|uniref:hypothetical protein n=1 Tax=Mesorhizobium sp. BR1-1-16 TaxID=2876653 RepID=UPI001CC92559|nr:hypothetical protein [Mesorhizobium sp. BR1-1-16]
MAFTLSGHGVSCERGRFIFAIDGLTVHDDSSGIEFAWLASSQSILEPLLADTLWRGDAGDVTVIMVRVSAGRVFEAGKALMAEVAN